MFDVLALAFPNVDPIAISVGPFAIRWYALAYILGILGGWWYVGWINRQFDPPSIPKKAFDDMVVWAVLGVILGGRLGYVLFYKPGYYLENPAEILQVWHGGMSFHGGMLGVIFAFWLFSRKYGIPYFRVMDMLACATPIGLFLGRLTNFINGELWGRTTDVEWGVVFPGGGDLPRHPSQLYEAGLEGIVLFLILFTCVRVHYLRHATGFISGLFLAGYGTFRFIVEFFREPDAHLGYIGGITMGQWLCIPMIVVGATIAAWALNRAKRNA